MKRIIALSILMGMVMGVSAQNYQTINSGRTTHFETPANEILSVRIDSVKTEQNDSVLFPFRIISQVDFDCYATDIASWIGPKIMIGEDGFNYFFNKDGQNIRINTLAALDEKWEVFKVDQSIIIEATVSRLDTLHFLGIVDSVKTITFKAVNYEQEIIPHPVNNLEIKLSKDHGLIKTLNFFLFPDLENVLVPPIVGLNNYNLVGMSNPRIGVQNLTWLEVHDYQPGDELHVEHNYNPGFELPTHSLTIIKFYERINYPDSIEYGYYRTQKVSGENNKFSMDTLRMVVKPNTLFDKLPLEPYIIDGNVSFNLMLNTHPVSKDNDIYSSMFSVGPGDCLSPVFKDGCIGSSYYKGLGGPYYNCGFGISEYQNYLVYYKKGDTTWGTPIDFTEVPDLKQDTPISIYPNPASSFIYLNTAGCSDGDFFVFDINGRMIKSAKADAGGISVAGMRPGLYSWRFQCGANTYSGKLIID